MSNPEDNAPVTAVLGAAAETSVVGEVIVTMRAYLSSEHLWTARHLARLASEREEEHQLPEPDYIRHVRSYVLASVCESVSFLESMINEIYTDAKQGASVYLEPLSQSVQDDLADWWAKNKKNRKMGTIEKFSQAVEIVTGTPLNKGVEPSQSVQLVIDLRNRMHHYEPADLGIHSVHKLEAQLKKQGFPDGKTITTSGNPWFPDRAFGGGLAEWAIQRVTTFADEFCSLLGVQPHYKVVQYPAH